jgi:hypothetical protein
LAWVLHLHLIIFSVVDDITVNSETPLMMVIQEFQDQWV